MPTRVHRRPRPALLVIADEGRRSRSLPGQALAELAAVILPVLLIVIAIIQFGLLFGANVSLTNAAREGARAGTIYVFDRSHTRDWNDAARCGAMAEAAMDAFGLLSTSAPYFSVTLTGDSCTSSSGETHVNGDLTVSYCGYVVTPDADCPDGADPDTTCVPETREGCLVRVRLTYRSDIVVPLASLFLQTDASGRFVQEAVATMVVN